MTRSEIDLKKKLWSLPGARVKNGHQHTVPLSDLAVTVIREAMADSNGEAIFPDDDGSPLISSRITRAVLRVREKSPERYGIAEWSPHDLRRTCLDNLARLGVAPHTIAHVANHRSLTKSGVTRTMWCIPTKPKNVMASTCGQVGWRQSSVTKRLHR